MWKRDEAVKPANSQTTPGASVGAQTGASGAPQSEGRRQIERDMVNIGKSVVIKGELNGSEDLTIEGHVEGKIELKDHVLTIGSQRQDQGAGVRQDRHRARRDRRQRHGHRQGRHPGQRVRGWRHCVAARGHRRRRGFPRQRRHAAQRTAGVGHLHGAVAEIGQPARAVTAQVVQPAAR